MTTPGIPRPFLFAGLLTLLLVAPAQANLIWHWTGDCVSQIPTVPLCQHAMIDVVTTDNYVPGTLVPDDYLGANPRPTILSFRYTDDAGIDTAEVGLLDFGWSENGNDFLFPAINGEADGVLSTTATIFRSAADGTWRVAGEGMIPFAECDQLHNNFCASDARGINGTWTRVPGPATLALVAIGLVGLVGLCRLTGEQSRRPDGAFDSCRSSATGI